MKRKTETRKHNIKYLEKFMNNIKRKRKYKENRAGKEERKSQRKVILNGPESVTVSLLC